MTESQRNGTVGFIVRELQRVALALQEPQPPERYSQLYLIQQALSWAIDPENFASPLITMQHSQPETSMDTQAG